MKEHKRFLGYSKEDWADLIEFEYEKDFERRNPGHAFYNRLCFSLQDMINEIVKQNIKHAEVFFGGITNKNIRWHEKHLNQRSDE